MNAFVQPVQKAKASSLAPSLLSYAFLVFIMNHLRLKVARAAMLAGLMLLGGMLQAQSSGSPVQSNVGASGVVEEQCSGITIAAVTGIDLAPCT